MNEKKPEIDIVKQHKRVMMMEAKRMTWAIRLRKVIDFECEHGGGRV